MKRWFIGMIAAICAAPLALAADKEKAQTPSVAPTTECIKLGRDKGLSGEAYDTFLRECITARSKAESNPAGVPKDITRSCSG
ncbi:MAG TPA: hypothetical protein VLW45_11565 [Pelomicrobium sp.]|nr:hypothetical protein [Pelomicrobium sp.]